MFGTSGVRGRVGDDITADLALAVGRAVAAAGAERVVVGRDARESGRFLADTIAAGVVESGSSVVRIGQASTPTVARAAGWMDADAGVSVTASHNPAHDNGIKLWNANGKAFDSKQLEEITRRVETDAFDLAAWDRIGTEEEWDGAVDRHVEALCSAVEDIRDMSVVVDIGNGVGRVTADALTELGCAVQTLNAQPDGQFPGRPSEPTADNCSALCDLVATTDATLGIAHDGDADRMMAVTEDGTFVSGDALLALFARDAAFAGERVAVPVDTSLLVADVLADHAVTVTRTQVGDGFVAERATEPDVAFGGEPSGAWIWPGETLCPDGPLAACKLAALVNEHGSIGDLVAELPTYPIERAGVHVERKEQVMERVRETVRGQYDDVTEVDGVRVELGDSWFLVRASGTEPLVRVTAEARTETRTSSVFDEALDIVETARAMVA